MVARERGETQKREEERQGLWGERSQPEGEERGKWEVTKVWERRLGHRERGGPWGEKAPPPRVQNGGPEWAVLDWGQGRCGRRRGGLRSIVGLFLHPTWNDREERQSERGRQTREPAIHARTEEETVTQKTRCGGRPVVPALRRAMSSRAA